MAGHTGRGVDLEQPVAAGGIAHHVDPAPTAGAARGERGVGQRAQLLFVAAFESRAQILGVLRHVFGVVVVEAALGHDPDRRQRLLVQHADGEFVALDQRFDHEFAVVARGQLERGGQIGGAAHLGDAHARAFV